MSANMGNSNNNNNIHNSTPLAPQAPETPEPDPARLSIDLEMSIAFANESRTPEDLFNSFYGATTTSSTAAQQASDPAASMPPITQSYVDVDADDDDLDEPEVALERTDEDIQVSLSQQSQEVREKDNDLDDRTILQEKEKDDVVSMSVANGTSISIEAKSANAESEEKNHTASHEGNLLTVDDDDQHIHMGVAVKHKDEKDNDANFKKNDTSSSRMISAVQDESVPSEKCESNEATVAAAPHHTNDAVMRSSAADDLKESVKAVVTVAEDKDKATEYHCENEDDQNQNQPSTALLTQAEEEDDTVAAASQQGNDVEMEDIAAPLPPVVAAEKDANSATKMQIDETDNDALERLRQLEEILQEQEKVEATLRETIDGLEAKVRHQDDILAETEETYNARVSELLEENEKLKATIDETKQECIDSEHDSSQVCEVRSIKTAAGSMRVSLDPETEESKTLDPGPEESSVSDYSDEDSTASDAGPPKSKLITNRNLRIFSRVINRFHTSKHHFKREVFNEIWDRLKVQESDHHQRWGYERPKGNLSQKVALLSSFYYATPDGQEMFASELDLVIRVIDEIQQCCEEGILRMEAVDVIISMKQNGRRQRKTRIDLNPVKTVKKKKVVAKPKKKVKNEEMDDVASDAAGSEKTIPDTEVLSQGQILTEAAKLTIVQIVNLASPDDFQFMRDIFNPIWATLTRQGGDHSSRWSWLRTYVSRVQLEVPDYVYATPFVKSCKDGTLGVDFFFTEIEVVWKVVSLIQGDGDSADGTSQTLSGVIVEKIQAKREESLSGLQKRKRKPTFRAEQNMATKAKKMDPMKATGTPKLSVKDSKDKSKATNSKKLASKSNVKISKIKSQEKSFTKKIDSSTNKKAKISPAQKKKPKKAVVEDASVADDKSTYSSSSDYSWSSSDDTEVIADGQLLTQVSMERCTKICNRVLGSKEDSLSEEQITRRLFNPIWIILKNQGAGSSSKWNYVYQSYNKLISTYVWAVPGNDHTNTLTKKPSQGSGYFETEMEVLACVCEYLRHHDMLSERAWHCIEAAKSQNNNSRSSRSRRASISKNDKDHREKQNSSTKSRKRKSSVESSLSTAKKKKNQAVPVADDSDAPKSRSVENKQESKAKSKPKATKQKKKVKTAHVVVHEVPARSSASTDGAPFLLNDDNVSLSTRSTDAGILRRKQVSPSSMSGKTDTTSGETSSLTSVCTYGWHPNFHSIKETAMAASTKQVVLTGITFLLVGVDDACAHNIRQTVLDLGGSITETIAAVQMPVFHDGKNRVFLLSHPGQRRSTKYIFAAALQIPMLHYNWVLDIHKRVQQGLSFDPFDGSLLESMRLPHGLSLSSRRYKLPPPFSLKKVGSIDKNFLKGITLMVVLGNQYLEEEWGKILACVGATVVPLSVLANEPIDRRLETVHAILTDSILLPPLECTVPVQLKHALGACGKKLPVVDLIWAIQCIVNRKKLNWEDNKIDLHDVENRMIYSVKRSDNVRFDIGDIVQLIEPGRKVNTFGRIVSFESCRSPGSYQHGFGVIVHLEEIEDRAKNLVDGGRVPRKLTIAVTSLVSQVVMMKGKDFRQIQSSYGQTVYVQKVMARKSTS